MAPPAFYLLAATLGPDAEPVDPCLFIGTDGDAATPETTASRQAALADKALADLGKAALIERLLKAFSRDVGERRRRVQAALPLRRFKLRLEAAEANEAAMAIEKSGLARGGAAAFDVARRRANELAVLLGELSGEAREQALDGVIPALLATDLKPRVLVLRIQ